MGPGHPHHPSLHGWLGALGERAFGLRLSTYMIANKIVDSAVPMSLLALHPNVRFSFYRGGIGSCDVDMH
jgi:glucosamine-6-phosphate deaminase